jgi:death on curing protein
VVHRPGRRLYGGHHTQPTFLEGNKRTGFVVGILFLELNGYPFLASEEDAAQAVLKLADGTFDETEYSTFLRENAVRGKKVVR